MMRMFLIEAFLRKSFLKESILPPFGMNSSIVFKAWERAYKKIRPMAQQLAQQQESFLEQIRFFVLGLVVDDFV